LILLVLNKKEIQYEHDAVLMFSSSEVEVGDRLFKLRDELRTFN